MTSLSQAEIAGLYTEGKARGASSLGLIVALYDTILRDFRRAGDAIAQGSIEKRTFELNHALRVIAELENALDYGRGGETAKKLQNFYAVTRGMIFGASARNSRQELSQLAEIFGTMRQAWHKADEKMNGRAGVARPAFASTDADADAVARIPPAESNEGSRGSWRA